MSSTVKYDHPDGFNPGKGYPWSSDAQILSWVPPSSRVLELGCATGYMGRYLKEQKNCTVVGVDADPLSVEKAKPHYSRAVCADLDSPQILKDLGGPFDVILCAAIVEHLKDPDAFIKSLKDQLTGSGRLIISLPNIAHWSIRLKLLIGQFNYTPYGILDATHLRFFTYHTAQTFMKANGYKIKRLSIDPDAGIPIVNGIVRRLPGGWAVLRAFYNLLPNLFGYQVLIEAQTA